jgi:hypothetical protein
MWKKPTREWIYVHSTHRQETLRLTMKLNELTDLEANYQLNHHEFYQRQEVERMNAIHKLMTRIHVTDTRTPLTIQEEIAVSKFYKFYLWHRLRKRLIATITILFTIILFMLTEIVGCFILHEYFLFHAKYSTKMKFFKKCLPLPRDKKS